MFQETKVFICPLHNTFTHLIKMHQNYQFTIILSIQTDSVDGNKLTATTQYKQNRHMSVQ